MTKLKKWITRRDVIGLAGLALAVVGITITVYINWQNKAEAALIECRAKGHAVQEANAQIRTLNDQLIGLEADLQQLKVRETVVNADYQRARRYFDALNAELLIGRTSSSLSNAVRNYQRDFTDHLVDAVSPEVWIDYLTDAGYPRAIQDRQRLARNLVEWGLESGVGNFLVYSPRDLDATIRVVELLQDLAFSMAGVRDKNYFEGSQGIHDTGRYLANLERNLKKITEDIRTKESGVENMRGKAHSLEAILREAKKQLAELSC